MRTGFTMKTGGRKITMYKVAICDDSLSYIAFMKKMLTQIVNENMDIYEYTSGKQLLQDLDRMHDIIILDIQLGDSDGNQVAKKIREVNKYAVLALCSGVVQPTPMAFEVDAYRYLLKCDSDTKTKEVLGEVLDEADRRFHRDYMKVNTVDSQLRVKIADIMYISKLKYGSEFHMRTDVKMYTGERLVSPKCLKDLYETMRSNGFEYAHSSYIVNCRWVDKIIKDDIRLFNGELLAVSRARKKQFFSRMADSVANKYP